MLPKRIAILPLLFAIEVAAQGNRILPTYTITQNQLNGLNSQVPDRLLFTITNSAPESAQSLQPGDTFRTVFQFQQPQPAGLDAVSFGMSPIVTSASLMAANFQILRGEFPT